MTDREIMQQALDVIIELYNDRGEKCEQNKELFVVADKVIAKLESALAQGEQEPVGKIPTLTEMKKLLNGEPIELAKPEQEFKYTEYGLRGDENGKLSIGEIPRKEWIGLTEDEVNSCFEDHGWSSSAMYDMVVHAIESKLKERNT
jgi:hypothetical protein